MANIKIATFNVENLFARPKVFNFKDKSVGDKLLARIEVFRKTLKKKKYTTTNKRYLVKEYQDGNPATKEPPLKIYIKVTQDRGKLWKKSKSKIIDVTADGIDDWDGTINFTKAKYSEMARKNTGKVIKNVNADIACIVEADNRITLKKFDTDILGSRYRYEMLLDGNDRRGIDVGLYSKHPIGGIWTHMFDGSTRSKTFSRDCPEYEIKLPNGEQLYILCNHLKSKGYDFTGTADERRERQAKAIVDILKSYDLSQDLVVVAGDLNDTPDSKPLKPLMKVKNLVDVLALQYPLEPKKRWTYHYKSFEQIDYLLVSKKLEKRFIKAGVYRKGMYRLKALTESNPSIENESELSTVSHWTNAASDHGAVWAEFKLD